MKKETSKVERILKLILFLDSNFPRSKNECLEFFEITESTFYEYIKLLRYSGFEVKQKDGMYLIDPDESENDLLSRLFHFTEEEAYLLTKALKQLDVSVPVAARLYRKLIKLFDTDKVLSAVIRKQQSEIISKISDAMGRRKQVLLINYASGNSQTIRNRMIEPFEFKHGFELLWAYDIPEQQCRQFKTSRIEDVEISPLDWKHEEQHRCLPVDVFRNTGELCCAVQMEMSLRAYNLLIEEYPLAEKECRALPGGHYLFESAIAKYEGAARFALGLAEEVTVTGSPGFLRFLEEKSKIITKKFSGSANSGVE